jgi:hypothetical protein
MPTTQGFFPSIWASRTNRLYLLIGVLVSIASWVLFKRFYPNTSLLFDSYYYIIAALENDPVHVWPIGYSKFLQLIGLISHSPNLVAATQYFLLEVTLLIFFFAIRYFFHLSKGASIVLFLFICLNPIYLYTSNFIMSDSLFMAISLLWLVNLLWIVFHSQAWMLVTQALLLFLAFTIRHTALAYPLIACIAILLSRQPRVFKIGGIILPFLLVGGFILYSIRMNEAIYGVKIFSPFQGWHTASNAIYVYEHVPPADRLPMPAELRPLDTLVQAYYRSKHQRIDATTPEPSWGAYYIFENPSPLLMYKLKKFGRDGFPLLNPVTFAKLGPLYSDYGSFILRKYPFTYLKHFVLPNIYLYLCPYPEAYPDTDQSFNLHRDTLGVSVKKWFGKNISLAAPTRAKAFRTTLFSYYQLVDTLTHLQFLLGFVAFIYYKGFKKREQPEIRLLWLVGALWVIQFLFIITAAASVFRFQLFITVVEFAVLVYFIEFIINMESISRRRPVFSPAGKAEGQV